ncbi:disease resistance protein SUMM2-like [Neltuma alba]|uniref:disease resistance protein SUMM2-like n=1 Tax=Neltuma alba TaxID=207710 RepID=UPI0010A2BB84|nr:disease resistance protein SUMM2-like [Prosopis alba]
MEGCLFGIANNEVQSSVNLVKNEAQYLCCFNNFVENFDKKKKILAAKHRDVKREFQKGNFKSEAQQWVDEADDIIHIDSKIKKRFLVGRCPNCWWQYRKGKELAKETQHIEDLLGRSNSNIIAGRANILDIKHLPLQDFLHFKSRESKFQDLWKALQDNNCNMIGLRGIGGAGKTSMAKEVAHKLRESNLIDKFIFLVVSKPPDFKKTREEFAKGLDLNLEEVKEEELSSKILSRITKMDKKLLITLDDVWEKFDLIEKLGIPSDHKGCTLLIITRSSNVCMEMECRMIELQMLNNKEALKLFEAHAKLNNSCHGLKGMPEKFVEHCGGIPVVIVAIARALKNKQAPIWKDALKTLEDRAVDQNLEGAYKCLKLSYDNLKNQKSKDLFLISSLFPEDYQVPIQVLTEIGIGLGSFGENDRYHLARSEVHEAIGELIDFSLLLHGRDECVEMHDSIREVALWIGERDIQSLSDSKMAMKESLRYLLWKNDDFSTNFNGSKLEVLLLFLDGSKEFKVSGAFFKEMMRLKVLVLFNNNYYYKRIPALSLMNSLQPLKDIRTLILQRLKLGDICALGNLLSLNTLRFLSCSIIELPREFLKLKKLGSLEVERCKIKKNNPFEVIERCTQLEELTFVANRCDNEENDAISHNRSSLTLHRYCISSKNLSGYFEKYGFMSRCVQIDDPLSHLVSETTFKQLVKGAELLILEGEDAPRIWKNFVLDDIVATDDRGMMNDLIVLHLSSCPYMEFLIDTKDHDSGVAGFCNLFGLHLSNVEVEDLCHGPLPSGVWEQLGIMKLNKCHRLKSILSNGNYNLFHLKSMKLEDCPMLVSVFQPSTARSLMKLEKLTIRNCSALECILVSEDSDSNLKSYHDSLFPKLKKLQIEFCDKLRRILPVLFVGGLASLEMLSIYKCEQLEYMFDKFEEGEDAMLPSLEKLQVVGVPNFIGIFREYYQLMSPPMQKPSPPLSRHNSNNINQSPARRVFSWVQACCSLNKSRPASEDTKITVPEQRPHDHRVPQDN